MITLRKLFVFPVIFSLIISLFLNTPSALALEGAENHITGDVDGNSNIQMTDVVLIQKHIAHLITLDNVQQKAADVDFSDKIDMVDVVTVQKYIARLITEFVGGTVNTDTDTVSDTESDDTDIIVLDSDTESDDTDIIIIDSDSNTESDDTDIIIIDSDTESDIISDSDTSTDSSTESDTITDTESDTTTDTTTDTSTDTTTDTSTDTTTDTSTDTTTDTTTVDNKVIISGNTFTNGDQFKVYFSISDIEALVAGITLSSSYDNNIIQLDNIDILPGLTDEEVAKYNPLTNTVGNIVYISMSEATGGMDLSNSVDIVSLTFTVIATEDTSTSIDFLVIELFDEYFNDIIINGTVISENPILDSRIEPLL